MGERRILAVSVLSLSLAALAATFQCCFFFFFFVFIDVKPPFEFGALASVTGTRPRLSGLRHLETFTCQNATSADRVTLPGRPGNPPWRVTLPIM